MENRKKKLGILLFNGPENHDVRTVVGLVSAALKSDIEVDLFLMYEGVLNASHEPIKKLAKEGLRVIVCSHNAEELKAIKFDAFKYGSQYDNAFITTESDRYVAFI